MKRFQLPLVGASLSLFFVLLSCSSDTTSEQPVDNPQQNQPNNNPNDDNPNDGNPTGAEDPQFDGFNLNFSTGDFWEFYWITEETNVAQGSVSASTDNGRFRVTLGESRMIGGIEAYALEITGSNLESYPGPRWLYLASQDNVIFGSIDGNTLETIFDAQEGSWTGGGFFANFEEEATINTSDLEIENEFIATNAIAASYQDGQSICEIIAGERVCANDDSFTILVDDFFKAGIGPVGYNLRRSVFDQGGGFTTSSEFTFEIGLAATSLSSNDGFVPTLPPWQEKTTLPEPFILTSVVPLNGKLYFFGGLDKDFNSSRQIYTYDPETDIWTTEGQTPIDLAFRYTDNGITRSVAYEALVIGDKIYFVRTEGLQIDNILIYDSMTNSWEPGPNLAIDVTGVNCYLAKVSDNILFFPNRANRAGQVLVLNTTTNTWFDGNTSPWPHLARSTVSAFDNKVYFSGTFRSGSFESRVRVYDSSVPSGQDGAWTDMFFSGEGRADAQSQVVNGRLYVMGGDNFGPPIRAVEEYDIARDTWETVGSMLNPRTGFSSVALEGKIYVFGGIGENFVIEEYDPSRDRRSQ